MAACLQIGAVLDLLGELPPLPRLQSWTIVSACLQIGAVLDLLGEPKAATEWFERLHSHLPQDPGVLARLGVLHAK